VRRFVEGLDEGPAVVIHDLLVPEIGENFAEVVDVGNESGDSQRALLCVDGLRVILYLLGERDEGAMPVIHRVELAAPTGARVTESRQPRADSFAKRLASVQLIAEHESFPGGRIKCDVSDRSDSDVSALRDVFGSWIKQP
jgi:hypothetical protein